MAQNFSNGGTLRSGGQNIGAHTFYSAVHRDDDYSQTLLEDMQKIEALKQILAELDIQKYVSMENMAKGKVRLADKIKQNEFYRADVLYTQAQVDELIKKATTPCPCDGVVVGRITVKGESALLLSDDKIVFSNYLGCFVVEKDNGMKPSTYHTNWNTDDESRVRENFNTYDGDVKVLTDRFFMDNEGHLIVNGKLVVSPTL